MRGEGMYTETDRITAMIKKGANTSISEKQFIELEIAAWKTSAARKAMINGERYYGGDQDIMDRVRSVIGRDGVLTAVTNLPNNKIVDNQYAKMVDQKVNYLVGQPLTVNSKDTKYVAALQTVFNKRFHRKLKALAEDSLNCGITWIYPYYGEDGTFQFKLFQGYEVLPFWKDAEHTILDFAVRLYEVEAYEGIISTTVEKVEVYKKTGIDRYVLMNNILVADIQNPSSDYLIYEDESGQQSGFNWDKIPLIAFKYNNKETPLVKKVKSLQDGINAMLSDFENNMQEDGRNTILIIKNYDGTDLGQFRHNLATYGAVKVKTVDGADGGVEALQIEVNSDNYKAILEVFKKALIENAMGYDAKDDRMAGTPNQMNIMSMYSDIDLDANSMETEYQAAFEELLWFINAHLANDGFGEFNGVDVEIIFNRSMMMNESETITNCSSSVGMLSNETILAQHPWVTDVKEEMKKIEAEKKTAMDEYQTAFPTKTDPNADPKADPGAGGLNETI